MSAVTFFHAFHFLRPQWLLALPVLCLLVWWLARQHQQHIDGASFIDADLLPALRLDSADTGKPYRSFRPWPWLALAWSLAVLALAGPSWQQSDTPAYRAPGAWVVVLDLSPSMEASDLAPNRVTRARYAIDDLLGAARDARVAMVVFSDEAYTVTPLTQDVATVRALMPTLAPEMMPTPGDHLAPALAQAKKLLSVSGAKDRRIVVVTDGFDDPSAALQVAAELGKQGISVSVIGAATASGAPVRGPDQRFAADAQGNPKMARLDRPLLAQLAAAGNGRYMDVANVAQLAADWRGSTPRPGQAQAAQGVTVAHWLDAGAYLLPMLLVLVALLARRRWL